jgi:hypothetical protein
MKRFVQGEDRTQGTLLPESFSPIKTLRPELKFRSRWGVSKANAALPNFLKFHSLRFERYMAIVELLTSRKHSKGVATTKPAEESSDIIAKMSSIVRMCQF